MAESSALLLRFPSSSSASSHIHPLLAVPTSADPSSPSKLLFKSPSRRPRSLRLARFRAGGGSGIFGNDDDDDLYGPYPWEYSSSSSPDIGPTIQWVQEEKVTLFTDQGLVQIGGSLVPRRFPASDKKSKGRAKTAQRFQRFQENDYMDPNQGLCLGALFDIAATNGLDTGRRLCIFGFCRSIEMLSDVVEDTVLEHGGERSVIKQLSRGMIITGKDASIISSIKVVVAEKANKGGLQEKLTMTVAVPLLWGVPPASETLRFAVRSGGGIVEKVYWQWDFL